MIGSGTTDNVDAPPPDSKEAGGTLEQFVHRQAARLWNGYQADRSDAVAELATLRRALPRAGTMPQESWEVFARGFPEDLIGHGDAPSSAELASAGALSLFALHQQSRRTASMHRRGREHSLGRAAHQLRTRVDPAGVDRRMQALTRTTGLDPVLELLRGLVTQLRGQQIPLDYASLARDLRAVQYPDGLKGTRVRWSRDFYRPVAGASDDSDHRAGDSA